MDQRLIIYKNLILSIYLCYVFLFHFFLLLLTWLLYITILGGLLRFDGRALRHPHGPVINSIKFHAVIIVSFLRLGNQTALLLISTLA